MNKKNAKESSVIKRLRRRLEKHLVQQESKVTPEALHFMTQIIRQGLERQSQTRIDLQLKDIKLFDRNEHPAKDAKATERLRKMIKRDYFH